MSATFKTNNVIIRQHRIAIVFSPFKKAYSLSCLGHGATLTIPNLSIVSVQCLRLWTAESCDQTLFLDREGNGGAIDLSKSPISPSTALACTHNLQRNCTCHPVMSANFQADNTMTWQIRRLLFFMRERGVFLQSLDTRYRCHDAILINSFCVVSVAAESCDQAQYLDPEDDGGTAEIT